MAQAGTFCPYKGLQPYTQADLDYFFGREEDQETITANLLSIRDPAERPPAKTPEDWREQWAEAADSYGQAPPPGELIDPPRTVAPDPDVIVTRNLKRARASLIRSVELQAACPS